MNVAQAVSKRIKELLVKNQMTLYRLEQKSGVLHGTMMGIMTGKNKNVTLRIVMLIAAGFDMKVVDFLSDEIFEDEKLELE